MTKFLAIYKKDFDPPYLEDRVKKIIESGLVVGSDGKTKLKGKYVVDRESIKTKGKCSWFMPIIDGTMPDCCPES